MYSTHALWHCSLCNVHYHWCFLYVACFDVPSVFHSPVFLYIHNVVVHTMSIGPNFSKLVSETGSPNPKATPYILNHTHFTYNITRISRISIARTRPKRAATDRLDSSWLPKLLSVVNPWRSCAARVTVVVLCASLSPLILALQAANRLVSNTNSSGATSARKLMWRFR